MKKINIFLWGLGVFVFLGFSHLGGNGGEINLKNQTSSLIMSDLLPPSFLGALDDQDEKVPLFWFSPQADTQELYYDNHEVSFPMYVSTEWYENKVGVRFSPCFSPFVLLKSKVFISYEGVYPDYNFKTPFEISINKDDGGIPGEIVWGPVLTQAIGKDTCDGEWVEVEHNLLIPDSVDFWIVFHWQEDFPTQPMIFQDSSPSCGRSFFGWVKSGFLQWKSLNQNLMIRALILGNKKGEQNIQCCFLYHRSEDFAPPDSFRIYRSLEPDIKTVDENLISTVSSDQLDHVDSHVENGQTYFYKVTAIYSQGESPGSNETCATPQEPAALHLDKDSIGVSLKQGEEQMETLNLFNPGGLPLNYQITIKMNMDTLLGGSDNFGYTWSDSKKDDKISFEWVEIQTCGEKLSSPAEKKGVYGPLSIGFPFPFYDSFYDHLFVLSNGCVSFDSLGLEFLNFSLPYPKGYFNLIAPFWSNLSLWGDARIFYLSTNDSLMISFVNMAYLRETELYTFQVILTPLGTIDFQYLKMNEPKDSATVGIQNQDGSIGLQIAHNQEYISDSLRIRINPSWMRMDSVKGILDPGENKTLSVTFKSGLLSPGDYEARLCFSGWDKNHPLDTVSVPVILKVGESTSVEEDQEVGVTSFKLFQNYPNPFNSSTTIRFQLTKPSHTKLRIYNIKGEVVKTMLDKIQPQGNHSVRWDGKDNKGNQVASGIYFYLLSFDGTKTAKKMLFIK